MNFFKMLLQRVFGGNKGDQVYRQAVDAGKAVAPVATPLVQSYLASKGLPTTPEVALSVLVDKATSTVEALPVPVAAGLQSLIAQHLP